MTELQFERLLTKPRDISVLWANCQIQDGPLNEVPGLTFQLRAILLTTLAVAITARITDRVIGLAYKDDLNFYISEWDHHPEDRIN